MSKIIPTHIAIICDGNRRWAKAHGWEVIKGHEYAFDKVIEPLARHAAKLGVKYLTFWVFSTENWQRDKKEVNALMNIFRQMFDKKAMVLAGENVKIQTIGDLSKFAQDIQDKVIFWTNKTKNNSGLVMTFAMNYGGRDEIIRAVRKLIKELVLPVEGQALDNDNKWFNQEIFQHCLDTADMPDPDLIIRTSGEQRTSGFMSWQSAYSEWYFPKWHFPEFTPDKLDECIDEFNNRQRRFGK